MPLPQNSETNCSTGPTAGPQPPTTAAHITVPSSLELAPLTLSLSLSACLDQPERAGELSDLDPLISTRWVLGQCHATNEAEDKSARRQRLYFRPAVRNR